jgi:hypothetical protein
MVGLEGLSKLKKKEKKNYLTGIEAATARLVA